MIEGAKYNLLELKENLENYKTKKENAIDLLEAIKAHEKLLALGERLNEYNVDTEHVDLCRCLVKLHFQLLILLESFEKLLRLISQCHNYDMTADKSAEVALVQAELVKAFKVMAIKWDINSAEYDGM